MAAISRAFTWAEAMEELGADYRAPHIYEPPENEAAHLDALLAAVEQQLGKAPMGKEWDQLREEKPELGLPRCKTVRQRMKWSEFVDPKRVRNV